jgi:2-C-methyl-D-erythritol 4-phosphate cytidylyltransferase
VIDNVFGWLIAKLILIGATLVMSKINYIIPAGGIGSRFGSEIPKQFIKLAGIPIIVRTLKSILAHPKTGRIIVSLHTNWHEHFEKLLVQWDIDSIEICNGGETRHHSIKNAIEHLSDGCDYIAIHDAVRPLFTNELLDRLIDNLMLEGTSIPLLPVTDTIKKVDAEAGIIVSTVDRNPLRAAQTPQMFKKDIYLRALNKITDSPTDDSSILEAAGYSPSYVLGQQENIKITTPYDMVIAELLLAQEGQADII